MIGVTTGLALLGVVLIEDMMCWLTRTVVVEERRYTLIVRSCGGERSIRS